MQTSSTGTRHRLFFLALAALIAATGCANSPVAPSVTAIPHILSGRVHGGQQPVAGAAIQLYAAGTSGYGSAAMPLLTIAVSSSADGTFSITGDFTCPSAAIPVYLSAIGGNAGAGPNPAAVLIVALGRCGDLASLPYITVNEVSTVAAAYALAQFMAPGGLDIGTSGTNATGLSNAFLTVPNLAATATGTAQLTTASGNGTVPASTLNTLANILAACVNSTGTGAPCSTLFSAAHTINDPAPTDILGAIRNIALNPAALDTAALYNLIPPTPPFQPTLTTQPHDWTIAIAYTGGGLNAPALPAVDAAGNLWVPNSGAATLSAFSATGSPLSTTGYSGGGLTQSVAAAVDLAGSVWISGAGTGVVSKFSSSGLPLSAAGFLAGTGAFETLAIDASGDVFASQGVNNTVYKLDPSGAVAATLTGGALNGNWGLAIDASGGLWVTDHGAALVSMFSSSGAPATLSGYSGAGLYEPYAGAIDRNGSFWAVDRFSSVSQLSSAGVPANASGYAIASAARSIAVDGDNTVWTANTDGSVTHLSSIGNALSPADGFQPGGAAGAGIALDASGNVWITDIANTLYQLVGAAAPITTPLAQAVKNNTLGARP